MEVIGALLLSAALHLGGDVLVRKSSAGGLPLMVAGALCFAAMAPIWMYLYRSQTMPVVACTYVPAMAVALALVGVAVFGDTLTPRLGIAAIFAMAAIITVSWPEGQ